MSISCLIVDDEKAAREGLKYLCDNIKELEVIGVCKHGVEAIEQIQSLRPQLLLLDVEMPDVNGFEVLQNLTDFRPHVIFITAHDQFAIKAFEVNAVDYLLKPFSDERFYQAIHRAIDTIGKQLTLAIPVRNSASLPSITDDKKLIIKVDSNIHSIPPNELIYIEAYDYYVKIHTIRKIHVVRETMKNLELYLSADQFLRIHKSYLVNRMHIQSLVKTSTGAYEVVLNNQETVKISRSKVPLVKQWLK